MRTTPNEAVLVLAGRPIVEPEVLVRRYCGLRWAGNPPETWAFRYFDAVPTDPHHVTPSDVLCAAAMHAGLSRADLAYFWDHRSDLERWLSALPVDLELADADDAVFAHLGTLPPLASDVGLSLVTKVLHRKRPSLLPMVDRELIDRYRPLTGQRRAVEAWPSLLAALAADLRANTELLGDLCIELCRETSVALSALRIVDISVWMDGRR